MVRVDDALRRITVEGIVAAVGVGVGGAAFAVTSAPMVAPTSSTMLSPRMVGQRQAIAGRSMPGSIRRLNRDIAINAPVLPQETAARAAGNMPA